MFSGSLGHLSLESGIPSLSLSGSGKGIGGDYSVIQVLKIINERECEQVAMYRHNLIGAHDFAQVCIEVSKYYNKCYMMVENNMEGGVVADTIWYNYEYDYIHNTDKKGIGTRSTKKTKLDANLILKRYMEAGWLKINDRITVQEMSRYEEISYDVFKARKHDNDDTVTSLLWGMYYLKTPFFDKKRIGAQKTDAQYRIEEDETLPAIHIEYRTDENQDENMWNF